LREQEAGATTADVCRKHGISSPTFYKWKAKYGGLEISDAKRLKSLEDENVKLKKLLAQAMLDNAMLKDIASKMVTPAAKREGVAHLRVAFEVAARTGSHEPDAYAHGSIIRDPSLVLPSKAALEQLAIGEPQAQLLLFQRGGFNGTEL
jgi:putative transposase